MDIFKKSVFFGDELKTEKNKKSNILILNKKYCGKTKKIIMEKSSKLLIS